MAPRPITKPRCHNCRRKKIKCDYQRPACGQCVRTRVQCLGYERDLVFVQHEAKPDSQVAHPKPSAARRANAAVNALPSPPSSIASTGSTVNFSSPSIPSVPNAGVQNRIDSFDRFLQSYLPTRELYTSQWLPRVSQSRGRCVALDCVANAISTMMMGQITENANYKAHALRLYGHALSDMRSTFARKSLQSEWHEVLMASMLMQIYESTTDTNTGPQGFLSHGAGITILMQKAGPEVFQDPPYHSTLLSVRQTLVARAIMAETPTFLASQDWMTVPWRKRPKDDYHRFLDILLQIPSLLYISNALVKGEDTASMGVQSVEHVLRTTRQMSLAMDKWHAHMQGKHGSLYKTQPVPAGANTPFSEEFAYTEFFQIQALFGVWHGKMILFLVACRLHGMKKDGKDDAEAAPDPRLGFTAQELTDAIEIADNICKISNFALRHVDTVLGAQFIMLPLKSAAECYAVNGMPEKQMWCFQKIGHILAQRFGLRGRMD